jgi:hypothetical protein
MPLFLPSLLRSWGNVNKRCTTEFRFARYLTFTFAHRLQPSFTVSRKRSINRVPCAACSDVIGVEGSAARPYSVGSTMFQGSSAS